MKSVACNLTSVLGIVIAVVHSSIYFCFLSYKKVLYQKIFGGYSFGDMRQDQFGIVVKVSSAFKPNVSASNAISSGSAFVTEVDTKRKKYVPALFDGFVFLS